jgi:hypothetical protein
MTKKALLPLLALALLPYGCAESPAPKTPAAAPSVLSVLQRRDPKTAWNAASEVRGDLNQDGIPDFALRGLRKDRVVVGIVAGPLTAKSRAWLLDFPWGKGTQDSLCSKEAKIEVEELDASTTAGAKPASGRKGRGISLYDNHCDAFHISWNPGGKKFDWWRL